jgi:2-keto-4-pentenoate hydratase
VSGYAAGQAKAAAQLLLAVRRRGAPPLAGLPAELVPPTLADAYAVQQEVRRELGTTIGGWKASLFSPTDGICAALHANSVCDAPLRLREERQPTVGARRFGVEPEVAFRLGDDLKPLAGGAAYGREDVMARIASAHAVIEVMVSRYADPEAVSLLENVADLYMNELLVVGPSEPRWRELPIADLLLQFRIDDKPVQQGRGGHPLNDPLLPVAWLANHLIEHGRHLRAGEIVTTGSWAGTPLVRKGQSVSAWFTGLGSSFVSF